LRDLSVEQRKEHRRLQQRASKEGRKANRTAVETTRVWAVEARKKRRQRADPDNNSKEKRDQIARRTAALEKRQLALAKISGDGGV